MDIPSGTMFSLYSGYIMHAHELAAFNKKYRDALTEQNIDPATVLYTKYAGYVNECGFTVNIPMEKGSLKEYRASFGHKLNHSFFPNADYGGLLDSPRFGVVRAFVTRRFINKDDELFTNYGYSEKNMPKWYRDSYEEIKKKLELANS